MFNVDMFNFAAKSERFHNPLAFGPDSVNIGGKIITIRNIGHLSQLVIEHLYANLGGAETVNRLLVLNEKKFNGFTVVEKFSLFEKGNTISMQGIAFEQLFAKVSPADFHADKVNSTWETVLESLGIKKPMMATIVKQETQPLEEVPEQKVTTVELVPTVTVNGNPVSNISKATTKHAEEATMDVVLKAVLDEMDDDTYQALKGLMIDEILVTEKLDPSKAAIAHEILMESVTLDILKSENPQEAILAILHEKVVSKEDFGAMVAKAEEEAEKLPASVVEALDIIDDKPKLGRQYPARRKGKR